MTYEPKTKPTDVAVNDFLLTVDTKKRDDSYRLIDMMREVSGEEPKMWGPSIIGFGVYHYVSKSNCAGDWMRIGFSPRKAAFSIYLSCDLDEFADNLGELGIYTRGKGCLYVKKLDDIDPSVLQRMLAKAYISAVDFDARKA